jgi:PAS domain S-box-containing protein
MDDAEKKGMAMGDGESFKSMADGAQVGFYVTDAKGNYQYANPYWLALTGLQLSETVGQGWKKALYSEDREMVLSNWDKVVETGGSWKGEFRFQKPDGKVIWIYGIVDPQHDHSGKVVMFAGMNVDVSDRKDAEEALNKQLSFMNIVMENAPVGFAVNDMTTGKVVFISTKFEEIYGVEKNSLTSVEDFFEKVYIDPIYREKMRARTLADIATGDPSKMRWDDIVITKKTGGKKYISATNIPIPDQHLMVSTVQDVTERKDAENKLQEKFDEVSRLNKLMIGRELEMVGLKNKIAELEKKLSDK